MRILKADHKQNAEGKSSGTSEKSSRKWRIEAKKPLYLLRYE
jgi:hypothetical protein